MIITINEFINLCLKKIKFQNKLIFYIFIRTGKIPLRPDCSNCNASGVLIFGQMSLFFSDFLVSCPYFSVGGVGRSAKRSLFISNVDVVRMSSRSFTHFS